MFCLDVRVLLPSVLHEEAKIACQIALDKWAKHYIPTDDVLNLIGSFRKQYIFI